MHAGVELSFRFRVIGRCLCESPRHLLVDVFVRAAYEYPDVLESEVELELLHMCLYLRRYAECDLSEVFIDVILCRCHRNFATAVFLDHRDAS